jgi:hypothetical protein
VNLICSVDLDGLSLGFLLSILAEAVIKHSCNHIRMKENTHRLNVDIPLDVYWEYKAALLKDRITAKEHINKFLLEYLKNV